MKSYNKTRKKKARQFKENLITKLDDLKTSNPQSYWKLLESLKDDKYKDNSAENIEMAEWELYFKKLNENCKDNDENILHELEQLERQPNFNELDFEIKPREITKAIQHIKQSKAPGMDRISNEMLKYSQHVMLPILTNTFQ